MKNLCASTFLILLSSAFNCSFSQNPYLSDINAQLRSIFSQINYPSSDVLFLYDRSAKLSDSTFYQNNSPDTLISTTWYQLYDEMYYAAHDTLPLSTHSDIEDLADSFSNDTIPIAIMDYDWYYCDFNSLETGTYFIFDTVNTFLYDKSGRPGWPFSQANLFAAAPLRTTTNFINPTFRIDPALFFSDNINTPLYDVTTLRIDFGDGTGWHYFDLNTVSHYQASYGAKGRKDIRVELLDERGDLKKGSNSTMNVLKDLSANTADYVFELPGLQIGVYEGCSEASDKFIIYLEGIDILDIIPSQSRGIDEIYEGMIRYPYLEELRNFGYTFYVVNWKNSTIDMRFNALHVVNLIEYLKRYYDWSDEQLVIIGESMGGVIARYALTYMESKDYQSDDYSVFFADQYAPANVQYLENHPDLYTLGFANKVAELKPLMHKTRELITIDSPHQGANIPLSVQHAYQKAIGMIFPSFQKYTTLFNIGLEAHAVKQLLLYHLKGKVNPLLPVSAYTPANEYYGFFGQLRTMGNYPKYTKLMALSSGSLYGVRQLDLAGYYRDPNDQILDFETSYNVKILKWKLPVFGAQLKMLTNPAGNGTIFQTGIGRYAFIIKLKWFGFKITTGYVGLLTDSQDAQNVKAHCVSAGGFYSVYGLDAPNYNNGTSTNSEQFSFLGPFGGTITNSDGCLYMDESFGFNGVFGAHNVSYSLCSKGFDFGFIPLQSALDYGNGLGISLDHNIQLENINTKLSRTPFDVIMGYANEYNQYHLDYRDETIFNVTKTAATYCGLFDSPGELDYGAAYYDADQFNSFPYCEVKRSLLCLEIGDEELYLENWDLNRTARFQVEYDLLVNVRNPYYEYPSYIGALNIEGIYSKEDDFFIEPTGYAKFYYNASASPTSVGLDYNNPQNSSLWYSQETEMSVCMLDYATKMMLIEGEQPTAPESINEEPFLVLIPNPAGQASVVVGKFGSGNASYSLSILDATGKPVYPNTVRASENSVEIDVSGLASGLYFVRLVSNEQQLTERLVIK